MAGSTNESVMGAVKDVLARAAAARLRLATAESCTGGLLSAVLTEVEGLSHVFERGFVVYTDAAKREILGVAPETLDRCGAVSRQVAVELAEGALGRSQAEIALSITGYADPPEAPNDAGLVYFGLAVRGRVVTHAEARFTEDTRARGRLRILQTALDLMARAVAEVSSHR